MAFPDSPNDLDLTVANGITYQYSAAKTAWIRLQQNISDLTLAGNVTANKVYTTELRWAGNGEILNSGITYRAATTPLVAASPGDQWYNTTSDVLYEYVTDGVSSYWVDIQSLGTSTGNAVTVNLDDLTLGGNIILTSNLVYSIGGDTGRLKSIFSGNVTTNTANIGTVTAGNITVVSNVTAGNVTLTGRVTATGNVQGNYMLGDGSKLTNLPATGATTGKAIAMAIVFGG
jgi:hypothetical protein